MQRHGSIADQIDDIIHKSSTRSRPDGTRTKETLDRITLSGLVSVSLEMNQRTGNNSAWYILDPHSRFITVWESVGALILFVVAIFTPFEICFMTPTIELFIFGRLLDVFFAVDMALQFFIMIPKEGDPGKLETRWHAIVAAYLKGWFTLDLMALAASIFDFLPMMTQKSGAAGNDKDPLTALRVVRVLRLIKLLRLIKASRLIKNLSLIHI